MINFETLLIIGACSIPFVALIFLLPKFKKKEKAKPKETEKKVEELKKEVKEAEKEEVKEEPIKEKVTVSTLMDSGFSAEEFRGYLDNRHKKMSKPSRVDLPEGFIDRTQPFVRRVKNKQEKPETVAEEIRSLSPELKALIFTGALDKKKFD